jgi:putative two-component system response regulator
MDGHKANEYCSNCQAIQPIAEIAEGSVTARRCEVCGFPVDSGLSMENETLKPANKILIVDDDPLIVTMYQDILQHNGFMVLAAHDGPTALDLAARERPVLILLDIIMPEMDGFEVCRRLKADPELKGIPVIILTSLTDPKLNVHAFKVGAKLALRKPAEPATILRTIQAALALGASR